MTAPGWYNDEQDGRLARWHDGFGWTAHTLVIADWTGSTEPPPPAGALLTDTPEGDPDWTSFDDTAVAHAAGWDQSWDDDDWYDDEPLPPRHSAGPAGVDWPRLAVPAAVVAAFLVALLAFGVLRDDDGGKDLDAQDTSAVGDIDEALTAARRGLSSQVVVSDADLKALIRGLCDVAEGGSTAPVAKDAALAVTSADQLDPVLAAAARGAADYCPSSTGAGGAVDDVAASAALQMPPVDTIPTEDSAVVIDPTSEATTGTTARRSGATTQSTTKSGGVTRTESRSQSSTSPSVPGNSTTGGDVTDVGNEGKNNQSTNTTIKPTTTTAAPTTTTTTTVAAEPTTTAAA